MGCRYAPPHQRLAPHAGLCQFTHMPQATLILCRDYLNRTYSRHSLSRLNNRPS
ncbi:MAG: hypothetical protein RL063_1438 [Pseudomonadota bacterium]|jgi:hypothetical protein